MDLEMLYGGFIYVFLKKKGFYFVFVQFSCEDYAVKFHKLFLFMKNNVKKKKTKNKSQSAFILIQSAFFFSITIFQSEFKYATELQFIYIYIYIYIYIKNLKSFSNSVSLFLSLTQNLQDFQEVNCAIFLISLSLAFLSCLVAAKTLEMINLTVFFFFFANFFKD